MKCVLIPVTHYQQNCSLFWCEQTREAAVVDPGGDIERILTAINANDVKVKKILLTHGHFDHAGWAKELAERLLVPIIGPHLDDQFWLQSLPVQAERMGFKPQPAFAPDHWLNHGDRVTVGKLVLEVLHCPGHTPGHVVFFCRSSKLAWVGDVLFAGSIGRTDFPKGDYETLVRSIRTHLWSLADDVEFIPGHGPTSTIGRERKTNPFVADHKFG